MTIDISFQEEAIDLAPWPSGATGDGLDEADAALECAVEALVLGLAMLRRAVPRDDLHGAGLHATTVAVAAARIGLVAVARIATDVGACAARGDLAGLGATAARLDRLGQRALSLLWNRQELPG